MTICKNFLYDCIVIFGIINIEHMFGLKKEPDSS